ncbi:hypothetical protein AB6F55_13495 [Providencia hangzhouensis]
MSSLFSSYLNAGTPKENTPYSFYQGMEIDIPDTSEPFYWLEVPTSAYINSAYPNTLQDVRVFNGTGMKYLLYFFMMLKSLFLAIKSHLLLSA